jgi:uncharacterized protein (DUF4415 family)
MSLSRQFKKVAVEKSLAKAAKKTDAFQPDPEVARHNLIEQRLIEEASYEPIPDTPKTVERKARLARSVMEEIAEIVSKPDTRKQQVTVRLDIDVLEWLKSGEGHWQSKLNNALRRLMEAQRP